MHAENKKVLSLIQRRPASVLTTVKRLSFFLLIVCWVHADHIWAESPSEMENAIGVLAQYKSYAEQQARNLTTLATAKEITEDQYRAGQILYMEAKASFDGWIEQLIFEIRSGLTDKGSPHYETMRETAQIKGDAFSTFVNKYFLPKRRRGAVGDLLKSFFANMKDVGPSIMKGFVNGGNADRTYIIEQIKGAKWRAFAEI